MQTTLRHVLIVSARDSFLSKVTYPPADLLQPAVEPSLGEESHKVAQQISEQMADGQYVSVALGRGRYELVAIRKHTSYSAQIDGPGCVKPYTVTVRHRRKRENTLVKN